MARNISRQVENGHEILKDNPKYDLSFSEIKELMTETKLDYDGIIRIIDKAFSFGVAIGYKISE